MRSRLVVVVVMSAALVVSGCGAGGGDITASGGPTPVAGAGGTDPGASDPGGSDPGGSGATDPSLDPGSVPGLLGAGDCQALALAIGSAAAAAFAGPEEAAKIEEELAKVKASVPEELQADIDTMTGAFRVLQEGGLIAAGEAMSSPEVIQAQERISAYLETNCGA